jgi:hypothetical protein
MAIFQNALLKSEQQCLQLCLQLSMESMEQNAAAKDQVTPSSK